LRRLREIVGYDKVGIVTAVHGLGGIGKTALAIEYAHAFAHEYPGSRWQVRCEGREDLRAALVGLAGTRDLEFEFSEAEKQDLALGFERVLAELKKRAGLANPPRVLLILDNVDQPKLLEPAQVQRLPQAEWLSIIVTTRLGEHELFSRQKDRAFLAVDELPESDALALIEHYQPGGKFPDEAARVAAQDIVLLLGRLTLAVEIAAVYLGQFSEVSVMRRLSSGCKIIPAGSCLSTTWIPKRPSARLISSFDALYAVTS
jgi:NB-ARC domain